MKKISIITIMFLILLLPISSFATTYVESKPGTVPWVNISVSDSYDVCRGMGTTGSSIGTGSLNPHLTTNKDYNAVSLLSNTNYGCGNNATGIAVYLNDDGTVGGTRRYNSTTGNASGVMNLGSDPYLSTLKSSGVSNVLVQTASLANNATNINYAARLSLEQNANTKFVEIIQSGQSGWGTFPINTNARNNEAHKGMGIWASETPVSATQNWGDSNGKWYSDCAIIIRENLFGFRVSTQRYLNHLNGRCVRRCNI